LSSVQARGSLSCFPTRGNRSPFFADWPIYRVSDRKQATLDIAHIMDRVKRYADKPFDLIQRNLKHFECGYLDLGVFKRRMGLIQTGCVVMHSGPIQDFQYGAIETIPIGIAVIPDPQWPVTTFVAAGHRWDLCSVSKGICDEPRAAHGRTRNSLGGPDTRPE